MESIESINKGGGTPKCQIQPAELALSVGSVIMGWLQKVPNDMGKVDVKASDFYPISWNKNCTCNCRDCVVFGV